MIPSEIPLTCASTWTRLETVGGWTGPVKGSQDLPGVEIEVLDAGCGDEEVRPPNHDEGVL